MIVPVRDCQASDVVRALERRYNPPNKPRQYATFTEVTDAAQRRRIDYLAVNLWQSRGQMLDGVEIKVDRRDWVRELAHPKADSWYSVVNHWWLAAPQGVVREDELPATWGLIEILRHNTYGWQGKVKVKAPDLSPASEWPNWLVMRLLTRVDERRKAEPEELTTLREEFRQREQAEFDRGKEYGARVAGSDPIAAERLNALLAALGFDSYERGHKQEESVLAAKRAIYLLGTGRLEFTAKAMRTRFREAADAIDACLEGRPIPEKDGIEF